MKVESDTNSHSFVPELSREDKVVRHSPALVQALGEKIKEYPYGIAALALLQIGALAIDAKVGFRSDLVLTNHASALFYMGPPVAAFIEGTRSLLKSHKQ